MGITEAKVLKVYIKEHQKDENFKKVIIRGLIPCLFFSTQSFGFWVDERGYWRGQCASRQVNTDKIFEKTWK